MAIKYQELRLLLVTCLNNVRVLKVGKVKIDIYIVGHDDNGILTGVQTQAVET